MEATALCITLWMTVFLQLCEQKVDADVWIEPSRLQVFEYEPVSLRCVGFDGLTDVNISRWNKAGKETCDGSKWGSLNETNCTITSAYKEDSGDYWCAAGGKKSTYVNVIVTAGSVILESPVLPVMEGESVTLSCRNKTTTSSILSAHFYKDGRLIRSNSTGNITIHRVSNSDEGLYKCSISDGGESPGSWLAVRAVHRETCPSSDHSIHVLLVLRTVFTAVMVALLLLLLLLVGLLHCGKLRVTQK